MHYNGLDLNLLVVLDALLTHKNVTRAAESLHVTQPAVSAALMKLRQHTSDPLLERIGRSLELTPRAREMAGPLKDLLLSIDQTMGNVPAFEPATAVRTFRLCMSNFCARVIGPALFKALQEHAPGITCHVDELVTDVFTQLSLGRIDIAITVSDRTFWPMFDQAQATVDQMLFAGGWVVVGGRDNPLLTSPLAYEAFCALPYIETRFAGLVGLPERTLHQQAIRPRVHGFVTTFELAAAVVADGPLVAIIPELLYKSLAADALKAVKLDLHIPALDEVMTWHQRNTNDLGHSWLRDLIKQLSDQVE